MEDEKIENVEEYLEDEYIFRSIEKLKDYLALITIGFPTIYYILDILFWPSSKWDDVYSDPLQNLWCSIVPLTAMILIFVEVFGELQHYKYYFCTTFIVYEFIGVLSIITYFYSIIKVCGIEKCIKMLMDIILPSNSQAIVEFVYFILVGFIFFSFWSKNTFAHISLFREKIFEEKPKTQSNGDFERPYDSFDKPSLIFPLLGILSIFLGLLRLFYYSNNLFSFDDWGKKYVDGFLWPSLFLALLYESEKFLDHELFLYQKCIWTELSSWPPCILAITFPLYKFFFYDSQFNYANSIFFWICCLSCGRQWFLDLEFHPGKYTVYFRHKFYKAPAFTRESSKQGEHRMNRIIVKEV